MRVLCFIVVSFSLAACAGASSPDPQGSSSAPVALLDVAKNPRVRAEHWQITGFNTDYALVDSHTGRDVVVTTDAAGNPAHAMGEVEFRFPGPIPDGTYTLAVRWMTGTMTGTPWAYRLGADAGTVVENGITSGRWHYFYPGHTTDNGQGNDAGHTGEHDGQWFTHDLAGPNPVGLNVYPDTPVRTSISLKGVGPGDFYIRLRDLSPARNNFLQIAYFELTPAPGAAESPGATASTVPYPHFAPVGDAFLIGVYYSMPSVSNDDKFRWEYAFMDIARHGGNFIVTIGPTYAEHWAVLKHWYIRCITEYNRNNEYKEVCTEDYILRKVKIGA